MRRAWRRRMGTFYATSEPHCTSESLTIRVNKSTRANDGWSTLCIFSTNVVPCTRSALRERYEPCASISIFIIPTVTSCGGALKVDHVLCRVQWWMMKGQKSQAYVSLCRTRANLKTSHRAVGCSARVWACHKLTHHWQGITYGDWWRSMRWPHDIAVHVLICAPSVHPWLCRIWISTLKVIPKRPLLV